jgi:carbon-monoxide dehydrogenase medium subunit
MYDFEYSKPPTLADAVNALVSDSDAKALAGGMTFIPVLKQRLNKPSAIVDLGGIGLAGIKLEADKLIIGAMTSHGTVSMSPDVKNSIPALAYLAGNIGDRQVRYRGTIGGSLANNDPSACYPSAVLALDATIKTDQREISAEDFFQGMFTTALNPGELITEVHFPIAERAAYMKFANPASRYAMVGVFVAKTKSGVRVAVTGAGQNGVFRHQGFEDALNKSFTAAALDGIKTPTDILNGDIHGSAEYRAHLIGVMAKRAVTAASA